MKVLLTGADGQLGRALQDALGPGHDLAAYGRQALDIRRRESIQSALDASRPDVVINAAAFTDVDGAETNSLAAYAVNALGVQHLAAATASRGLALVHLSTDYVFDGAADRPYHEFDRPNPLSVYGKSKLAGEQALCRLNPRHYLIRTAWLYHVIGKNFARRICALSGQPEVCVVNDRYGSPTYAPHLAAAIARLIQTGAYGTYHLAGAGGATWFAFAKALYQSLGLGDHLTPVVSGHFLQPAQRPRYAVLTSLSADEFILPPWQEGVREFALAFAMSRQVRA